MKKNMLSVPVFLFVCLFSPVILSNLFAQNEPSLKDVFKDYFKIGGAINQNQSDGKDIRGITVIQKHFNTITPENIMKWERIHPGEGKYNFEPADNYVSFGEKNNMYIIGHTLIWHSQTPKWVFEDAEGKPVDRNTLLDRMKDHIQNVMGRYKGKIKGWDVVNEALDEDGTLRKSKWLNIIGEDFIEKAFQFAAEADPDAELYYNDYSIENSAKLEGVLRIVNNLKAKGIKISGIGIQGHYGFDFPTMEQLDSALKRFSETGLKLMFTELDLNILPTPMRGGNADIATNIEAKAKYNPYTEGLPDSVQQACAIKYHDIFKLFVKYKDNIDRVTFWGVTDGDSWLNNWPVRGRTNYPLLFDRNGKPKYSFEAVISTVRK